MDVDEIRKEYVELEKLYRKEGIWNGQNPHCRKCHQAVKDSEYLLIGPQLPFVIGKYYREARIKLMFVGKVLEGIDQKRRKMFRNAEDSIGYYHPQINGNRSRFWGYITSTTRVIDKNFHLLGEGSRDYADPLHYLNHIVVTNAVQCGAKPRGDGVPINIRFVKKNFAENCISGLQVINRQIEILQPHVVIFLTSWDFDKQLEKQFFPESERKSQTAHSVNNGNAEYWYIKSSGRLLIGSFHPGRQTRKYWKESQRFYLERIKEFVD